MKIKKFNNLWTMGLIMFFAILLSIYLIKIINPAFIIGVAQTESIVTIGKYIDTHKWAYCLATCINSFILGYLFCCASCKKKFLNLKEFCVLFIYVIISFITSVYLPKYFSIIDICLLVSTPLIINNFKNNRINICNSLGITFIINNIAQFMSLEIRNIGLMVAQHNYATYIVLLIDAYIWLFVLYFYFNFKKENK